MKKMKYQLIWNYVHLENYYHRIFIEYSSQESFSLETILYQLNGKTDSIQFELFVSL